MPHRAVVRENKDTTKVRIVFDASSKVRDEPALNDCLYSSPCLLPAIYDILLRLRLEKIAFISDIKQAFLNITIAEEHRDYFAFYGMRTLMLMILKFLFYDLHEYYLD